MDNEKKFLTLADGETIEFKISVVGEPAILSSVQLFNKSKLKHQFKEVPNSKNLIMGYAMIADLAIDRYDEKIGRYQVEFPRESINRIVENFSKNGMNKQVNENHNQTKLADGIYVLHNWQLDSEIGIIPPKGFEVEPDGSWFVVMKCDNPEIRQKCLDGIYNGFSVESTEFVEREQTLDELLASL